ncbi:hypothetical protein ZIOFF_024863 [Zingiber officinale]|uniref:Uncharacterized protein n=1 Tax=Zingiber officinale TaxID=94328 RepID=A0A8J5LGI5_ZINOF|nr:hypothetical protein ZIOFF_024863 [Zingiber officinale]
MQRSRIGREILDQRIPAQPLSVFRLSVRDLGSDKGSNEEIGRGWLAAATRSFAPASSLALASVLDLYLGFDVRMWHSNLLEMTELFLLVCSGYSIGKMKRLKQMRELRGARGEDELIRIPSNCFELNMKHILKILALLVVVAATWITLLETSVVPHHYTWLVRSWFDAVSNMSPGSCTFAEGSIIALFLFSDLLPLDAKPPQLI